MVFPHWPNLDCSQFIKPEKKQGTSPCFKSRPCIRTEKGGNIAIPKQPAKKNEGRSLIILIVSVSIVSSIKNTEGIAQVLLLTMINFSLAIAVSLFAHFFYHVLGFPVERFQWNPLCLYPKKLLSQLHSHYLRIHLEAHSCWLLWFLAQLNQFLYIHAAWLFCLLFHQLIPSHSTSKKVATHMTQQWVNKNTVT